MPFPHYTQLDAMDCGPTPLMRTAVTEHPSKRKSSTDIKNLKILQSIILILLLFGISTIKAQPKSEEWAKAMRELRIKNPYDGHYTLRKTQASCCMLDDSLVVDRCKLKVTYSAKIMLDTIGQFKCNDLVVVERGDSLQKFYSQIWLQCNRNHTFFQQGLEDKQIAIESTSQPAVDYAIYRDLKQKKIISRHMMYNLKNRIVEYKESLPNFDWVIFPDTITIEGYSCQKAQTHYAGRLWTVWFTSAIPVDGGLWKFNGLPGLILEAYDAQDYFHFTMQSIEQVGSPIVYYHIKTKQMTRMEFRELERKLFRNPFPTIYDGMAVINPQTGKSGWLPADWQMPYNPIELE